LPVTSRRRREHAVSTSSSAVRHKVLHDAATSRRPSRPRLFQGHVTDSFRERRAASTRGARGRGARGQGARSGHRLRGDGSGTCAHRTTSSRRSSIRCRRAAKRRPTRTDMCAEYGADAMRPLTSCSGPAQPTASSGRRRRARTRRFLIALAPARRPETDALADKVSQDEAPATRAQRALPRRSEGHAGVPTSVQTRRSPS